MMIRLNVNLCAPVSYYRPLQCVGVITNNVEGAGMLHQKRICQLALEQFAHCEAVCAEDLGGG